MPIYEYRCQDCATVFSRLQSISNQDSASPCPECGGENTERLLSTFAAGKSAPTSAACPSAPTCGAAGGG